VRSWWSTDEESQGIVYFVGLLAFVALMGVLALWN